MPTTLQGRCHCGGVRFLITGRPGPMGHCHCSRCRKACGAAFHTAVTVREKYFRWVSGRDLVLSYAPKPPYNLVRDSCRVCGCYLGELTGELSGELTSGGEGSASGSIVVSAAILEGDLTRRPLGHEWVSSAVAWYRFGDGLPCYDQGFPPPEAWQDPARLAAAASPPPAFRPSREVTLPLPGSCLCGGVRYEVAGALSAVVNCHCVDCRGCQGVDFATNASVAKADFRLLSGESLLRSYESSPGKQRCFCTVCGSPLFAPTRTAEQPRIRMGTLDADPCVNPTANIWLSQSTPWQPNQDGLPAFQAAPGGPIAQAKGASTRRSADSESLSEVRRRLDAIVLMGPPGAGKSFLGNQLAARGIASYLEIEPLIVEKFGNEVEARIAEVGRYLWRSYQQQLQDAERTVVFESAGIADRSLLETLDRKYRSALVWVRTDRELCIDRVADRGSRRNISHTTDRAALHRHYDLWCSEIAPTYEFALIVDGGDSEGAVSQLRDFLRGR